VFFIPEYRTDTKVPALNGRVLDANTKSPLCGAKISLIYDDYIAGEHRSEELGAQSTDANGNFRFLETLNHYYIGLLGPCGDDLPHGKHCTKVVVSKVGYEALDLDFDHYRLGYYKDCHEILPDEKTGMLVFYMNPTALPDPQIRNK